MSNLNLKVKHILEDIIDLAYKDEPEENRENYKRFYIKIIPKECQTVAGWYKSNDRLIEVFNLSRGSSMIVKTCIHELAHHIDQCRNGCTGHQAPFYEEYKQLLYAGLNMQIFSAEDVRKDNWANDRNKVCKILDAWVPDFVEYNTGAMSIYVNGGYEYRTTLKENGYSWDNVQKSWCKDVEPESKEEEEAFLDSLGLEYRINEGSELNIDAIGYIVADGNTYDAKELLKAEGFFFQKNGKKAIWKKKVNLTEAKEEINRLKCIDVLNKLTYKIGK